MNTKNILLPHTCQKIGWWLLMLIPLLLGFYWALYCFFRETQLFATVNDNDAHRADAVCVRFLDLPLERKGRG